MLVDWANGRHAAASSYSIDPYRPVKRRGACIRPKETIMVPW